MAPDVSRTQITVFYKWTAKPGKLEELKSIYADVLDAMQQNEPDAESAHCYVSGDALYVEDVFKDAAALGFHLSTTAGAHFPQLLQIATPGPFFFCGDVPDGLKQATEQMQLGAEFSVHAFGFDR